ncbi:MAG: ATP-binding protein [Bacteroidales bacterium]|nr:ATP-binding protein [Bacteroidales bacterium]MBK9358047.1 ATP-binding protein [Bacteroidales bacterium]
MGFRKFRLWVFVRILLITANLLLLIILVNRQQHEITSLITGIFAVVQIGGLIHYVERTNRKLTQFLESIRHSDFSTSFSDKGLGHSFEGLNRAFNEVIREFRKNRAEKEEHYNYLLTVVQHVSIGIIAFRKDGKVDIINNAVKRLLKINNLMQIQDLSAVKHELPGLLLGMSAGDRQLIKLVVEDELQQLSVYATEFRMRGEEFLLVSIQNISSELEEKEIESWQKLIRVLTHEIMNSITPISSLASTVQDLLLEDAEANFQLRELDEDDIESIQQALSTIQSRSQGLLTFVETYRNLTRIPRPNFRYFPVRELFDRAHVLLKPKMDKYSITCNVRVFPEELMLTADPDLIDQVVINLLLNAIDAVKEEKMPHISVTASFNANGRPCIDFADNGSGIKPDILDKVFMPFFTSKKDGSGIGLSLSRQIMHLHKGTITVKSKPGEGAVFSLVF